MVYKMNESIIVIQAEATSPNRTNVVFWSHDRGTAKLRMKLVRKNGIPQSLPEGTTVPIRLMFKSATAEGGYGKHDYLATVEDPVNGIVSIVLEDNILGYVGTVEGSVYIDFPNDRSLDTAGRFTFYIKRSPIDDSTPELEDYYFNGFSQTIDKVEKILADGKQEIEQKIAESETQIDAKVKDTNDKITKANQDVATINTNIDKANDRIDQTNQQISDLGKMKKMYSNSIDFGDYDYSGNPNLFPKLDYSKLSKTNANIQTPPAYVKDHGTYFEVDMSDPSAAGIDRSVFLPLITRLQKGKTYTISANIMISDEMNIAKCPMSYAVYRNLPQPETNRPVVLHPTNDARGKFTRISKTFTVSSDMFDGDFAPFLQWYFPADTVGKYYVGYDIKIEESSTATPYQPNLLVEPYNMCREYPNENIADPTVKFPISSGAYSLYQADMKEEFIVGQTYTITMKATNKPSTQTFIIYNEGGEDYRYGNLKPVEGLVDIWGLTFTPQKVGVNYPKRLTVIQYPQSTTGACQIDWLKIEKGDTRTPNISEYKYFGEGLKDSNNPNDYSWDVTPEYTEKGLNDSVSLTEPQSVEGLKNFEDGLQIAGKEVATVPEDTGWVNLTAINGHSWNKQGQIRRIGKLVMFRGSLKGSTLSTQDFCTIPEGFRPSNPTDNYEYQFLLPPQSSNTLDNGGMAYIRPNGVCGLPSFRGTVNLFLAPIQYYID
ncbi:BppU family phage baseplate upper protein [Enterococcus hirae]|uniref:BppU family phage baseplate upper protein n=1 Tax=Enterococcus hirae TaxID=1354 RepID=UPI00159C9257|nr:BppU family phage baseplate upper protein [Enterococcus hirae]MBA5271458.1 BppU family phage baseplate upper protein [Enterococcus hirae]NVL99011.1 BppU family phage baseplate upper protein [Enterococcus hirae]